MLGSARAEALSYSAVKLFSKNSNLCDHGTWTLHSDRRTTCDRNTALCTTVHRAVKTPFSPPSLRNTGTRCACSLARTLMNFLKWATLRRVRNSISFTLRSRGCSVLLRSSLCVHVIHPALASSVRNNTSASMRSNTWLPLTVNLWISFWSKGRSSPDSAPISAVQIAQPLLNQTDTVMH